MRRESMSVRHIKNFEKFNEMGLRFSTLAVKDKPWISLATKGIDVLVLFEIISGYFEIKRRIPQL